MRIEVTDDNNKQITIAVIADTRNFDTIIDTPWLRTLNDEASLDQKYRFLSHQTLALLFAAYCSGAASFLYIKGGEKQGLMFVIGGVTVNLTQNMLYSVGTYFFIKDSLNNFKQCWGRLSTASFLAGIATAPSTISAYKLSEGSLQTTIFTASGNLPNNIFGLYNLINRPLNYLRDKPKARQFLMDALHEELQEEDFSFSEERSTTTKVIGTITGLMFGVALASAQAGYICSSCDFGSDFMDKNIGTTLGISANVPSIAIALLMSGIDLGNSVVNTFVDTFQQMIGNKKTNMSAREKMYLASYAVLLGASSYWAYYSSATSEVLYGNCPSFDETADEMLSFSVVYLTKAFNGIMSGYAIKEAMDHLLVAYSTGRDRQQYHVTAMENWIKNAPIKEIEAVISTHFPDKKIVEDPSCFSRLRSCFWRKPEAYLPLPGGEEKQEETQSLTRRLGSVFSPSA